MSIISRAQPRAQRSKAIQLPEAPMLLTPGGAKRLQNEIEYLKRVRLPTVIDWMRDLASDGFDDDVSEYERARSEHEHLRWRIREIDKQLASSEVLVDPIGAQVVQLGSRVTVTDGDTVEIYRLVGRAEADPSQGYISDQSPLGNAILGRRTGDRLVVQTPDGPVEFRVVEII